MGSKAINLIPGDATTYAQSGDTLRTELELGIMEQLNKQLEPLKKKAETVMVSFGIRYWWLCRRFLVKMPMEISGGP